MTIRTWVVAAFVSVLGVLGLASPASAADELQLSPDGVGWSSSLPSPLFDPAFRWVPGDSQTASFYVRNQTGDGGVLNLIMLPARYGDLMAGGDLTVSAQVDGGTWMSTNSADSSHILIAGSAVPAGAVRKINVRIDFNPASTNATQDRQVGLAFDVNLSQGAVVLAPTGGGAGNGPTHHHNPGSLPNTGNDLSPSTLLLAVLLCASGAGLALLSQRNSDPTKEKETSHA